MPSRRSPTRTCQCSLLRAQLDREDPIPPGAGFAKWPWVPASGASGPACEGREVQRQWLNVKPLGKYRPSRPHFCQFCKTWKDMYPTIIQCNCQSYKSTEHGIQRLSLLTGFLLTTTSVVPPKSERRASLTTLKANHFLNVTPALCVVWWSLSKAGPNKNQEPCFVLLPVSLHYYSYSHVDKFSLTFQDGPNLKSYFYSQDP